jgi:hypothetical protein
MVAAISLWLLTECSGLCLVTQGVDNLGRRPDERDTGLLDLTSELGIFGQESIATSNNVSQARHSGIENNTNPGWIMSTPCSSATRIISS